MLFPIVKSGSLQTHFYITLLATGKLNLYLVDIKDIVC